MGSNEIISPKEEKIGKLVKFCSFHSVKRIKIDKILYTQPCTACVRAQKGTTRKEFSHFSEFWMRNSTCEMQKRGRERRRRLRRWEGRMDRKISAAISTNKISFHQIVPCVCTPHRSPSAITCYTLCTFESSEIAWVKWREKRTIKQLLILILSLKYICMKKNELKMKNFNFFATFLNG